MADAPRQLALALPVGAAMGRADFLVTPSNARAMQALDAPWPEGKLIVTGPEGSGKTHLARIWAAENGAVFLPGLAGVADLSAIDPAAVVLDDADAQTGPQAETLLFHLYNLVQAARGRLLLTARTPPARWPVVLPDLASRLATAPLAALEAPDDALLAAVLVKLFADRQLIVPPTLIHYLTSRMERSLAAAQAMVAALDTRALAEGRAITRAMATDWLDNSASSAP